ncbi:unnamed protein product [Phyllotreta striolata]|uniref:Fumarylacetoacetase-like C-terminal domain-containing protein n=1 Tax=Phyllotreta striolata TaxID=444603 RepID=A0A9P0DWH3_PHYSR|nr:unnamed protein product [Phyllotreta striolata]
MYIILKRIRKVMNLVKKVSQNILGNNPKMRIVQFRYGDDKTRIGVLKNDRVVDVNATDPTVPYSLVEFLQTRNPLDALKRIAGSSSIEHNLSDVKLLSPITKPDKILGVASNYKCDCTKRNIQFPKEPTVFTKFPSVITGPYDEIPKSPSTNAMDWEIELVAVIGKTAKHVKAADAMDFVFGYTVTQDLTAKDWVMRNGGQLVMCKGFDGFCPLGPWIVTKEELGDPYDVRLRTWINGELKQDGHSSSMLQRIDKMIEYLSSVMTLLPGDLILTGTPYGVGASQIPPQYLKSGDVMESEIDKIGKMSNKIV